MDAIVFGDGPLGHAIADELTRQDRRARLLGRPESGGHAGAALADADVVFDASRGDAVAANVEVALAAGCQRFVLATTGWDADRARVEAALIAAGARGVAAANFSLGAAVFLRIVEAAADRFAAFPSFEPFLVEWHRRDKRDRPSGTARELARRIDAVRRAADDSPPLEIATVRAGSSPGSHVVGFDSPGETVELRLTARDRSAYATGAVAAADWLLRAPRPVGLHPWDAVVDDLVAMP